MNFKCSGLRQCDTQIESNQAVYSGRSANVDDIHELESPLFNLCMSQPARVQMILLLQQMNIAISKAFCSLKAFV